MKSRTLKTLAGGAAALAVLGICGPVIADDTEILLVDPAASGAATPPNILFILDTSGSMGDSVSTTRPFDITRSYLGDCDENSVYWTTLDVVPSCLNADGSANQKRVAKTNFYCDDSTLRMSGIGSYTGVMAQHRDDGNGSKRWQELIIANATDPVECQDDAGIHGDGTAGDVYATAGSSTTPFTSDSNNELTWGSGDAAQAYTVYDGKYLNSIENPETVSLQKIEILRSVATNLMNAIEDVNVGIMRFNNNEGGRVIHAISDLDADRSTILSKIKGLTASGVTPLAETLYEAALYWRGMDANYGARVYDSTTGLPIGETADADSAAFLAGTPGTYQQPTMPSCTSNFNVLLTDGVPVGDIGAQTLAPTLPDFSTVMGGATACDGTGDGHCLDDIGAYLANGDLSSTIDGQQVVRTHTIGFDINLPILQETATESGGTYYLADDVVSLTNALMQIVDQALEKGLSFSAPTVAVNAFNRTTNFNDLYLSSFRPEAKVHWPGNLKKYTLDGATIKDSTGADAVDAVTGFIKNGAKSFWTVGAPDGSDVLLGGAANRLPDPTLRKVYTNLGTSNDLASAGNTISTANTALTLADFGLTGSTGEPTLSEIIGWTRGEDVLDVDNDPATTVRYVMGDALHSQPAAIVYGGTESSPDVVVFTATNDGYFHAIDADTGTELWSFIPKQLLDNLPELMLDGASTYKNYGIDGDIVPVVSDENNNGVIDGNDFVHIIFGMRRGGNHYFSIDVTNKNDPQLNWAKTYPEFGQSWSRPVVARVDIDEGSNNLYSSGNKVSKTVVIIGEGYDTVHDTAGWPSAADNVGAGISMLDLFSGDRIWRAGRTNADLTIPEMTRAIPSQVRAIDFSGDGFVDRMYAVDIGGQVLRFDVFRGQTPANAVTGGVIAQFGGEGSAAAGDTDARRFYTAPDVSIFADPVLNRRFAAVGVGSGYRAHPLDTSAADAYFSLRDEDLFTKLTATAYSNYNIATPADLVEVSGQVNTVIGQNDRGWKFSFESNQMMLSASTTFDNSVFFISYEPDTAANRACRVSPGSNYLHRVSVANGDPVANNLDTMLPSESNAARTTPLQQGGIAPTPAFLFPSEDSSCLPGEDCDIPPIGCVGPECFDPGFDNNPVRTLWTQDGIE